MKRIPKVILLIYLIPFLRTQNIRVQTPLSNEQVVSNESKQTINEGIHENSEHTNEDNPNNDPTSTQVLELKIEHNSQNKPLFKNQNDRKKLDKDRQSKPIINSKQKELSKYITSKAAEFQNKRKNFDKTSESDQDEQSSEHSSEEKDLIDDRPSVDERATSKLNKKLPQTSDKRKEKLNNSNTDLSDTRPVKDGEKTSERFSTNDFINTRRSIDEDKVTEKHNRHFKHNPNEHKIDNNINTIIETDSKIERKQSKPSNKQDKVIHSKHSMVSVHDFAYMAAVLKGGKYLCAGALIDENWVLTAANGMHLMRDTIKLLRIRLGSLNFKKGGTLLPIKYFETHPYFNSSKPDYDLALLMVSKPVRFTVNIRSIRLQLTPKDITATHCIMTSWHAAVRPGLNQSTLEVMKQNRILSVAHLHPTDPEDCLQELKELEAGPDGVMCLEGEAENTCVRDTGAPVVINGVLWGIISSWKPQECDDEVSTFATLVSGRNISTWLHATVHGHRWHPE